MNHKRHAAHCTVCQHPEMKAIEAKFLDWESPRSLENGYSLPQTSVYRHAKAFNLYETRQDNVLNVLERLIEQGIEQLPAITTTNLIEAIKTHAKLTGRWVDQTFDLSKFAEDLDDRSTQELEFYEQHGQWPATSMGEHREQ